MKLIKKLKNILQGKKPCKLAVGYQIAGDVSYENIVSLLAAYYDDISELVFPLPDLPCDSPPGWLIHNISHKNLMLEITRDLRLVKQLGIPGVLMLNGTCYGAVSMADEIRDFIIKSIQKTQEDIELKAVMAHSLFIADTIRNHFPNLELRADANMHVKTIEHLQMLAPYYDGFYIDGDVCRNLDHVKKLHDWCKNHGKSLHLIANSSCLYNCPYRITCSNMTSHGVRPDFCQRLIGSRGRDLMMLQGNWIRPEDLEQYSPYFDTVQLITRESRFPKELISAYLTHKSCADLHHLLSPDISVRLGKPRDAFPSNCLPPDWFARTSTCNHQCDACHYCHDILTGQIQQPTTNP